MVPGRSRCAVLAGLLLVGCGPTVVRLQPKPATSSDAAIVEVKTRTARVVAFDDKALPRPARDIDDVAVEVLPGGHCVYLVRPRLWSAFDRAGEPQPSELSEVHWFEAKQGAKYVIDDYILEAQMLDQYMLNISEILSDGSRRPVGGSATSPPQFVTCRPSATR